MIHLQIKGMHGSTTGGYGCRFLFLDFLFFKKLAASKNRHIRA
jgi:hypothetical protein